jgi:hypothetical protein
MLYYKMLHLNRCWTCYSFSKLNSIKKDISRRNSSTLEVPNFQYFNHHSGTHIQLNSVIQIDGKLSSYVHTNKVKWTSTYCWKYTLHVSLYTEVLGLIQLICNFFRKVDMHDIQYMWLLSTALYLLLCTCGFQFDAIRGSEHNHCHCQCHGRHHHELHPQ